MSPIRAIPLVCFLSGGILSPAPSNLLVLLLLPHLVMRALYTKRYVRNTATLTQWQHIPLSVTQHHDGVHIPTLADRLCLELTNHRGQFLGLGFACLLLLDNKISTY